MPRLDAEDERVLGEMERFRQQTHHRIAEPRRWERQLQSRRRRDPGLQLEGIVVSIEDAQALVAGEEMSVEVDDSTRAAVSGYRDA